jgi:hypothetical protein
MLDKLFKKSKSEKRGNMLLLVGIIIVVLILAFYSKDDFETKKVEEANVTKLLNEINDNYTVDIVIKNSTEVKNYNYSRDSKIELLDEGDYSDKAYLIYNNHYYSIDVDNYKLTKVKKIDKLNNPYTNIDLIKKVINKCELEYVNDTNKICTINENEYFKEYNIIYNTNYTSDKDMTIKVCFLQTSIYSIEVDYTNIDKIINNNDDILKYEFLFSNINKNNYSDMMNYYKKDLK